LQTEYIVFVPSVAQQPHDCLQGGIDNVQPINIFRIGGNSTNQYAIFLVSAKHNGLVMQETAGQCSRFILIEAYCLRLKTDAADHRA
jgi:hypothetical protein